MAVRAQNSTKSEKIFLLNLPSTILLKPPYCYKWRKWSQQISTVIGSRVCKLSKSGDNLGGCRRRDFVGALLKLMLFILYSPVQIFVVNYRTIISNTDLYQNQYGPPGPYFPIWTARHGHYS